MSIVKFIAPTDLGTGLSIVGNKVVTDIDPQVVNDLVTLSGMPVNSKDLAIFSGSIIPDAANVKAAIQALETAIESQNIEGQYAGLSLIHISEPTRPY